MNHRNVDARQTLQKTLLRLTTFWVIALLFGCSSSAENGETPPNGPSTPGQTGAKPIFRWCLGSPFVSAPPRDWDHAGSALVELLGDPGHSAEDVVAAPEESVTIRGKFTYGFIFKELEHETVRVSLDDCSGWSTLGDVFTDGEGRIALPVAESLPAGAYGVWLEVMGDGSLAGSHIWMLPQGTRLAVVDIDGTLTTSDTEMAKDVVTDLFAPIFRGDYTPQAYPGANDLTQALHERGLVVVYLTGRPTWLAGKTRDWLTTGEYVEGPLRFTSSVSEWLPVDSGVGAYKLAFLQELSLAGLILEEAYGNATTDIHAYLAAGIPAQSVFIIGRNAGAKGTVPVASSWEERAATVRTLPKVDQPFDW